MENSKLQLQMERVKQMIDEARAITILSHINPDADTLGTALGIFALLFKQGKRVEVVNASTQLPKHLDFLPFFSKLKHKIDFADSLIITCDAGSLDRFGFDLTGRMIINIDHHISNTFFGDVNVVFPNDASTSQVAFKLFSTIYPINAQTATAFYTALLSDTRYFTTSNVTPEVFDIARELVARGANPVDIAKNFTQRRSLSSVRVLERALHSLTLTMNGQVATMQILLEDIEATGATMPDMEGIVDYGRSLATVELAVLLIELKDGWRVSIRSKTVDITPLAKSFGGGGHKVAAGFTLSKAEYTQSAVECHSQIATQITQLRILQ